MSAEQAKHPFRLWLTIICGITLITGVAAEYTPLLPDSWSLVFYIAAYLSGGYAGVREMLLDLRNREINIDFLMVTAAIGAAIINQWMEGAILLFLFSLSENLEGFALGKSRTAIQSLIKLRPEKALVRLEDGMEREVPVGELEIGQTVVVKPGQYIPIDGNVVQGQSEIDQSAITGESVPVLKSGGDSVFAATLNKEGVLWIEVTKQAEETTLAKIIDLVEKAQSNKAQTQRFLEKFEPYYAFSVVLFTAGLIVVPWLLFQQSFEPVFYRAMTVLVVASPCALIISTPAAIISAIANGARHGILFKGGAHIEQSESIDTIAFDKTGTLTLGKPAVTSFAVAGTDSSQKQQELLRLAAGCERYSEHHLAAAILEKASEAGVQPAAVQDNQTVPGKGVYGTLEGERVSVGNLAFYKGESIDWPDELLAQSQLLEKRGNTIVLVAKGSTPIGLIALADKLRPGAEAMIRQIRSMGIRNIVMLTGDNAGVANHIAKELKLDGVHAELLPDEKVNKIEELKKGGSVAMVGDGINDAPALAVSDLGIAMGAAGTDVALETADVVLMGDDLSKIPYLLWLSRRSKKIVWQNIYFSLGVIFMLLAGVFLIDLPLTLGVIGHEGSTLIVVLNGLRLLGGGGFNI